MPKLVVSNSRLNLYRKCHYAHYLKYYRKLIKKSSAHYFQRGKVCHAALESYNNGGSWKTPITQFRKEFKQSTLLEERALLGDIPQLCWDIIQNYVDCYGDDYYEYLAQELRFEIPLCKDINLLGFIDSIVADEDGGIWIMDHKIYKRMPDQDSFLFNTQSALYDYAMQQLGIKTKGTVWDVISAKPPTEPSLLKSGKLSTKQISSTPSQVQRGLIKLGLDPKEHQEFIERFGYNDFYKRILIRSSKKITNSIVEDAIKTAKDILKNGHKRKDKNLGKDCNWCAYKNICQIEMMGYDPSFTIKKDYKEKEDENGKEEKQKETERQIKRIKQWIRDN